MTWYVLYVKARCEKRVAEVLEKLDIEVYCPLVMETRQWSDRKKTIETPLFKSYVFVRLKEKERPLVFQIPGVVRYIFWLGQPAVVRPEEIDTIKQWLQDDLIDGLELSQWVPGKEITIEKGLLKNRQSIVKEIGNMHIQLVLKDLGIVVTAKIKGII